MFSILNIPKLILWVVVGIATVSFTVLTIVLEPNLAYFIRRLFPRLREKGGRPPAKKPIGIWVLFLFFGFIIIFGTAFASSTPDVETSSIPVVGVDINSFVDARDVDVAELFPNLDITTYNTEIRYVNMDGFGADEIVVYAEKNASDFIDVFSFDAFNEWRKILHLTKIGNCGVGYTCCGIEFDFLNVFKNTSRELLVFQQCGSGAFVSLQVYQYRGLSFAELVYETEEPISSAVVSVVNDELYITSYDKVFHLVANDSDIFMDELLIRLPPNVHEIHFWRNNIDIVFIGDIQNIQVGDFLLFIHDRDKDITPCSDDLRVDSEYLSFTEHPNLVAAIKSGETKVIMACRMGMFADSLDITIR